jgi:hypothetical protein
MVVVAAWASFSAGAALARDPDPVARVPLEPMGYGTLSPAFLVAGSSMLTVDFVDKSHLLVTFGVRRLMKREADAQPDDDDRVIGAFLVELPTGKVLARTEWRLHDRGQYLWSLGHGRFVLRVRDSLTMIAPMAELNSDDPFRQIPFLRIDRRIEAILVSPDDDLLTIETTKAGTAGEGAVARGATGGEADAAPVQINFYRLTSTSDAADGLRIASAGAIRTRVAVELPITTSGFLDVAEGGRGRWQFSFSSHTGKVSELSPFDTSCFPRPTFVGHGEFVAFGCRGSDGKQDLAGFNLKGEEMWQQNFLDTHISPSFSFAPAAGRFALSRLITADGSADPVGFLAQSQVGAQEVRVYQSHNGQQLFRMDCTPVERAGQNFALSPDGLEVAVVREAMVRYPATKDDAAYTEKQTAVEIYALPAPSDSDRAAVKEDEAMAPSDTGARIDLSLLRVSAAAAAVADRGTAGADESAAAAAPAAVAAQAEQSAAKAEQDAPAAMSATAWGDPQPDPERKRPSLYGPDETAPGKTE